MSGPLTLSLIAAATLAGAATFLFGSPASHAEAGLCTLVPGGTHALVRVERDTTLPFQVPGLEPMSYSGMGRGPGDSLLAAPGTPMPAALVRLLQLDSATRASLADRGIGDPQPLAYLRAAPYRADCRVVRWTDTIPFVERGEVGYVRATLAPREQWIEGVPVLVIPDAWRYPYPRRRGLAWSSPPDEALATADAMFSLNVALAVDRPMSPEAAFTADSLKRTRALEWAVANPVAAELEPARTLVREAVLAPDWRVASRAPSRLRGSYRVHVDLSGTRTTWYFRTHERPGYTWRHPALSHATADLLASPHIPGYRLVGYPDASHDSLPGAPPDGASRSIVWLATDDRPTAPGNDARRVLSGVLEFTLSSVPESLWDELGSFVPAPDARESALRATLNRPVDPGQRQPVLPLTIRLGERGTVRADTTLQSGGRTVRVVLERLDTVSVSRPWQ